MFKLKKVPSEEEAQRAASRETLEDGDYRATFDAFAVGKAQKSGRDMATVGLLLEGPNGSVIVTDYWVDTPKAALKIRHAAACAGVPSATRSGRAAGAGNVPRQAVHGPHRHGKSAQGLRPEISWRTI